MAASKQASTYVNTLPQCSPASVGLAQVRPNYAHAPITQTILQRIYVHYLSDPRIHLSREVSPFFFTHYSNKRSWNNQLVAVVNRSTFTP